MVFETACTHIEKPEKKKREEFSPLFFCNVNTNNNNKIHVHLLKTQPKIILYNSFIHPY